MLGSVRQLVAAFFTCVSLAPQPPAVKVDDPVTHAARVEALRAKAEEQILQDRVIYSESQLQDIEARYQSAHQDGGLRSFLRRDAAPILSELIAVYPKSNRSGCAALQLARLVPAKDRERYLKEAIANHSGAWCESGVQVGALARALLAVQYAGSGKFDDAERLARELLALFPGAIDESGAPLDNVLEGIRLLRERDPAAG
jgi:hypothetical protein